MLMIRPVLRMNRRRVRKTHIVVFFIFLISNIGGVLTPLGDPPLLLGLLHGVPFFWTLTLFPQFALLLVLLLSVFFLVDSAMFRRESIGRLRGLQPRITEVTPRGIQLRGLYNLIFLAGVVAGVLFSGSVRLGHIEIWGLSVAWESVLRDLLLLLMGQWSLRLTPRRIREAQGFNWRAMKELAFLFGGMFITLLPVLAMLRAGAAGGLALVTRSIHEPWHYFWVTGLFSSFLDNAPTYLAFVNTVLGAFYPGRPEPQALQALLAERAIYLKAISCGAVFMGAMTYLGNAPNFMVRSIAEEYGVKMPSFLGYMVYSTATLLPCFVLVCFLFFGP
jgi:Na+/H+ antiporter NhaD/arsenite permease-like protein